MLEPVGGEDRMGDGSDHASGPEFSSPPEIEEADGVPATLPKTRQKPGSAKRQRDRGGNDGENEKKTMVVILDSLGSRSKNATIERIKQ